MIYFQFFVVVVIAVPCPRVVMQNQHTTELITKLVLERHHTSTTVKTTSVAYSNSQSHMTCI